MFTSFTVPKPMESTKRFPYELGLFDLPAELRLQIYENILAPTGFACFCRRQFPIHGQGCRCESVRRAHCPSRERCTCLSRRDGCMYSSQRQACVRKSVTYLRHLNLTHAPLGMALLRACRQVAREAAELIFECNTFIGDVQCQDADIEATSSTLPPDPSSLQAFHSWTSQRATGIPSIPRHVLPRLRSGFVFAEIGRFEETPGTSDILRHMPSLTDCGIMLWRVVRRDVSRFYHPFSSSTDTLEPILCDKPEWASHMTARLHSTCAIHFRAHSEAEQSLVNALVALRSEFASDDTRWREAKVRHSSHGTKESRKPNILTVEPAISLQDDSLFRDAFAR